MRLTFMFALVVFACAITGCAIKTEVLPAKAAAAEVAAGKAFTSPTAVEYAFQPSDLDITVSPIGYTGSACSFPLSFSTAFYSTFDAVNQQAFRNIVALGTPQTYKVRVELNSFDHSLIFASRFFGSTAVARAEITARVSIMDPTGHEISRQMIRGNGQDQEDVGSCAEGSGAVSTAAQKALRQLSEEYADRVINGLSIN